MTTADPKKEPQIAENLNEQVAFAKEATGKVSASLTFIDALQETGPLFNAIAHALPPVRLALGAINAGWDLFKSAVINKDSKLSIGGKALYVGALIGFFVAVIAAPAIAAVLYAVAAGVTLIKDGIKMLHSFKEVRQVNHQLKSLASSLKEAEAINHFAKVKELTAQKNRLEQAKLQAKAELHENITNIALGVAAIAGLTLLAFPPTSLAGAVVLLGTAVAGLGTKFGLKISNWIKTKSQPGAIASDKPKSGLIDWIKSKFTHDNKQVISTDDSANAQHTSTYAMSIELCKKSHNKSLLKDELTQAATHQQFNEHDKIELSDEKARLNNVQNADLAEKPAEDSAGEGEKDSKLQAHRMCSPR